MEEYEAAKLRMQCLELAQQISIATCAGSYQIMGDAEKYWKFVCGPRPGDIPVKPKTDDIPF
jgi:hypothetical protein